MQTLLKIQTSLFSDAGQSSQLADRLTAQWLSAHPHGRVVTRDLSREPVPHLTAERFQAFLTKPEERTPEQREVVQFSDTLIQELRDADVIVLTAPMYNFSIPSTLRAYFDHIARSGVTFRYTANGPEGLIKGKKIYSLTADYLSGRRQVPMRASRRKGSGRRLTVEGARPNAQAIWRSERPSTNPREISSRSARVKARIDRRRDGGWMPPEGLKWLKIEEDGFPNTLPIDLRPSPLRHLSQISALSAAV